MSNLLKIANPDEALYREIMLSLGYKNNKIPFLELATLLPYSEIKKLSKREVIEQALLYRAGFSDDKDHIPSDFDFSLKMTKDVWTYKGTRPSNFPEKRINQITYLLIESVNVGIFNFFKNKIEEFYQKDITRKESKRIVLNIMSFRGLGAERKVEMFFNIIVPFFSVIYGDSERYQNFLLKLIETHPAMQKRKINKGEYKPVSMLELFGFIEYSLNKE